MGAVGQYFGGTRRHYYSKAPETTCGTAVTIDRVLNPIDGSELLGPIEKEILSNAGQAQGQGELETAQIGGAQITRAAPSYHLTPEAVGRFLSSLWGLDTKGTFDTSGFSHAMTFGKSPKSFTMEEHCLGAASTTLAWKFAGAICTGLKISHKAGQQFCTITPRLTLSKYAAPADHSTGGDSIDVIANWPGAGTLAGMPPTQVGLFMAPTTGDNHTMAFDGTISPPTAVGTIPTSDLGGGSVTLSGLASGWDLDLDGGQVDADRFRGGMYAGAGFIGGIPINQIRAATLAINLDSTSATDGFVTWMNDITSALQKSWSFQAVGISDYVCGATLPSGFSIAIPAMVPTGPVKDSGNIGPTTRTATFKMIQAAAAVELAYATVWDKVNQDYA